VITNILSLSGVSPKRSRKWSLMAIYEFFIRVEHLNDETAAQQIEILRQSVFEHAKVIHTMLNGTTTVSPTKKIIIRKKRKAKT
jgi:hypothetical protein